MGGMLEWYQTAWMFESHYQQRLSWEDAQLARVARVRSEARSEAQLRAMLDANPSGSLGDAMLNDPDSLEASGLL